MTTHRDWGMGGVPPRGHVESPRYRCGCSVTMVRAARCPVHEAGLVIEAEAGEPRRLSRPVRGESSES